MRTVIPACLLLVLSASAGAADLDAIAAAIADGHAETVVGDLVDVAEHGDPRAQTMLAELYQRGEGVARNAERAVQLYRLAAEQFTALTHVYVSKSSLQRIANSLDGESIA